MIWSQRKRLLCKYPRSLSFFMSFEILTRATINIIWDANLSSWIVMIWSNYPNMKPTQFSIGVHFRLTIVVELDLQSQLVASIQHSATRIATKHKIQIALKILTHFILQHNPLWQQWLRDSFSYCLIKFIPLLSSSIRERFLLTSIVRVLDVIKY